MNWKNLKTNKCPKCNTQWDTGLEHIKVDGEVSLLCKCGFKIDQKTWKQKVKRK